MSSRDLSLVHPELRRRVNCVVRDWGKVNPKQPRLIVTAAMRTREEQERLYAKGRGEPGPIVTHAAPGMSLHEYGLAVDFGFVDDVAGVMDWSDWRFIRLGPIIERYGLEWGGRWPGRRRDLPHAQAPVTWQEAERGVEPEWSPLPEDA